MHCSKSDSLVTKQEAELEHKKLLASTDMQSAFIEITELVESEQCENYLLATSRWLEEKSIPLQLLDKYIPSTIIEKIKEDANAENMLRPSVRVKKHISFDALYDL